jgi:3-phosphoshikimate 1-carboxyvinyltransferase
VRVPPDKSIAIRAALLSGLASSPRRFALPSAPGADLAVALAAAPIVGRGGDATILCGGSATLLRLLTGIAATGGVRWRLEVDAQLALRPQEQLAALFPPGVVDVSRLRERREVVVTGRPARGDASFAIDPASAQLKGAALLSGLAREGTTVVREERRTRDHTERLLAAAGARIEIDGAIALRGPAVLAPLELELPGDPSACALLAIAALGPRGGRVRFDDVATAPLRTRFFDVLARAGARTRVERRAGPAGEVGAIEVERGALTAVTVEADEVPGLVDEVPALGALACLARGSTVLRGLGVLRTKESDRIETTAALARAFGARATVTGDDLAIEGPARPEGRVLVETAGDHRIAMAALALGRALEVDVSVDDEQCIAKSFPGFAAALAEVALAAVER